MLLRGRALGFCDQLAGAFGIFLAHQDSDSAQGQHIGRILGFANLAVNARRFEQAAYHQRLAFLFRRKNANQSFIRIGLSSSSFDHCPTSKFDLRF